MTQRHLLTTLVVSLCLAACSAEKPHSYPGYVEGEYVYLSVPVSGYLSSFGTVRGGKVKASQAVFTVNAELDRQGLTEAQARSSAAGERANNLQNTKRAQEIASAQASLQSAKSALDLANSRLARDQQLANQNFVSAARVDETRSLQQQALAQWEAAQAQLKLTQQPVGRNAELLAAQDDFKATQSVAAQKQWLVEHSIGRTSVDGELVDTFFRVGEWVTAGRPVASVLPDSGRLVRFFVPESLLAQLKTGQTIQVRCDGCTAPIFATIESISSRAEYTPPVIYSKDRRDKLVFRVDARPTGGTLLPPGLPVDITLPGV